jgi:hypothetical protein
VPILKAEESMAGSLAELWWGITAVLLGLNQTLVEYPAHAEA